MKYNGKQIFRKYIGTLIFVLAVLGFMSLFELADKKREPLWQSIHEYQRSIEPRMIIDIMDGGRYSAKAVIDWKIDELAVAMANADSHGLNHPLPLGSLIVQMDTNGTEIESSVRLALATEGKEKILVVYFTLSIMRDGESYASVTFAGEELNNWARSVGIVRERN